MPADPARRHGRCNDCGKLVPLDDRGRIETHVPDPNAAVIHVKGWCPASGQPWRLDSTKTFGF